MPAEFTATDHAHMARALQLAERGLYTTQPNPRVGCVIAQDDTIVGEGWHERAGEPHAEVFALRAAAGRARGATAYVTLEPCGHFGRTPPCADALVAAGIGSVIAAAEDPNPRVNGGGLARLREAGIDVRTGLLRDAARELNRGFFSRMERQRPWVRIKLAMSLDGRTALADGTSKWITGEPARADVQRWRARSSAILTGIGTVLADDPRLTVRRWDAAQPFGERTFGPQGERGRPASLSADSAGAQGRVEGVAREHDQAVRELERRRLTEPSPASEPGGEGFENRRLTQPVSFRPLRVVLDASLKSARGMAVLDGSAPTLVLHAPGVKATDERFAGIELAEVAEGKAGRIDLEAVMQLLAGRGVNELQVEAGPTLCGALFAAQLVDELLLYVAPVLLGDTARPLLSLPPLASIADARRLRLVDRRTLGDDERLLFRCGNEG